MLLSIFIVCGLILVAAEGAEEKKQKKIQNQNMTVKKYLRARK